MATIKSYSDLEQSRKLAEILPIESADMCYLKREFNDTYIEIPILKPKGGVEKSLNCWSLAALLNILESEIDGEEGETYQLNIEKDGTWWNVWYREQYDEANPIETESTEDLVDACVNMIIKLKERGLL